jgi:hypothetical protein
MIKIDISKAIPTRMGRYLLGIIPGVLFELSIAIGDPSLANLMLDRVKRIYPFQPYALLVLFLISCLVIGQVFFLMSWFADMLIGFGYVLARYFIRITLGSQWLYRLFAKLQGIPPRRNIFIRLLSWMIFRTRNRMYSIEPRPVIKCLHLVVTELLKRRYGIDRNWERWSSDGSEWGVWYSVLGKPPTTAQEALMTMRTILGCGLAGFSALYVSPTLRGLYFIILCVVFTLSGCYLSFDLVKWRMDPLRSSFARLRSVLLELSETQIAIEKIKGRSEKSLYSAISTETKDDDD